MRELAVTVLEEAGYHLIVARDGEEAIQFLDQHAEELSAAVLDVIMPRKGGKEVHAAIKVRRPEIPVIFSTGYGGPARELRDLPGGGSVLLEKPYSPDDLLLKLREVLDGEPVCQGSRS